MRFTVEIEREEDGRWLAKIPELSGVLVYGQTRTEAISRVQAPRAAGVGRSSHIPSDLVVRRVRAAPIATRRQDLQVPGRAAGYPNGSPCGEQKCCHITVVSMGKTHVMLCIHERECYGEESD